jgi:hypothetical protein
LNWYGLQQSREHYKKLDEIIRRSVQVNSRKSAGTFKHELDLKESALTRKAIFERQTKSSEKYYPSKFILK